MRTKRVIGTLAAIAMAGTLFACGKAESKLTIDLLDEASGVKVVATNAGAEQSVSTAGAITVEDGDVLVISPCLDKGSLHLTVTSSDGNTVAYDDDVDGRIMFQTEATPDTYDVYVEGKDATGWMTVFAQDADELAEQDASLDEALTEAGVDPSIVSDAREEAAKSDE